MNIRIATSVLLAASASIVPCTPVHAKDDVKLVGHYSNLVFSESEDPHLESGYSVDLYWKDNRVFGTITIANGSIEPAQADLQQVAFDEATGRLTFRAVYSSGREYSKDTGPDGREAWAALAFNGTLTPAKLAGYMATRNVYCKDCKPEVSKVLIKREKEDTSVPDDAAPGRWFFVRR